ncbi:uncharacterized protein PHACADRAFT_199452 [Phanerochaete carnosa HHB-10118-sp]|uniref:Uncharacterized protein n=1 Tax=Phanerochaete carnosa (strain HHB-10118-sp) TaxID=650164 RepID=K5VZB4_PHACS|nr:uncharacterized protein PHACADRAFT_199452 [Phanerochaete carnosa HHB-10118-sp]EKM51949.1 hypothetical protein PHACADRAFT_199452 [Phanerochaete carnosa HHB-10118-sp]
MSDLDDLTHDDFVVLRRDDRFGGFEECAQVPKENPPITSAVSVRYFRKSIMPGNNDEFTGAMQMVAHFTKDCTFSTLYPSYSTPDGRK